MMTRSSRLNAAAIVLGQMLAFGVLVAGCLGIAKPSTPTPPDPPLIIDGRDAEFAQTCAVLYRQDRGRDIDASTAAACLDRCRRGATGEEIAAWFRSTRPPEPPAPAGPTFPIRAKGDRWVDASGAPFVPNFESLLTALRPGIKDADWPKLLTAAHDRGANGVRVFGGALVAMTWAKQTADGARSRMPAFFQAARDLGLVVEIAIITDSGEGAGYDIERHLVESLRTAQRFDNAIVEIANEFSDGTQHEALVRDPDALCALAKRAVKAAGYTRDWALGAAPYDGLIGDGRYGGDCGTFNVVHTKRSRDHQTMLDRAYALVDVRRATGKPVISSEPIGADEKDKDGSRESDASFFRDYAAAMRKAGVGAVFHSEAGLRGQALGKKQAAAAVAFHRELASADTAPDFGTLAPRPRGWDSCVAEVGKNAKAIVACHRARYYGRVSLPRVADLLGDIARDLTAAKIDGGPFGRLVKTSGTTCGGYSCDVVCAGQGAAQRQWDTLSNADGVPGKPQAGPTWDELDRKVVRLCEVPR